MRALVRWCPGELTNPLLHLEKTPLLLCLYNLRLIFVDFLTAAPFLRYRRQMIIL